MIENQSNPISFDKKLSMQNLSFKISKEGFVQGLYKIFKTQGAITYFRDNFYRSNLNVFWVVKPQKVAVPWHPCLRRPCCMYVLVNGSQMKQTNETDTNRSSFLNDTFGTDKYTRTDDNSNDNGNTFKETKFLL